MKKLLLSAIILISVQCGAQSWKQFIAPTALSFVGGVADGVHQTLVTKYSKFEAKHPNANPKFWNPDISWKNKYKDWDAGNNRAAFPLSTGPLVLFTDGYHLTQATRNITMLGGFSYTFALIGPRKKWYVYLIAGTLQYAVNRIGFEITYNIIY